MKYTVFMKDGTTEVIEGRDRMTLGQVANKLAMPYTEINFFVEGLDSTFTWSKDKGWSKVNPHKNALWVAIGASDEVKLMEGQLFILQLITFIGGMVVGGLIMASNLGVFEK